MAEEKVLIRDCKLYINTGTHLAPTWTQVKGLHPDLEWSAEKSEADTTDQDCAGFPTHFVSTIKYKATVKGKRMEDVSDGSRDPGQAACETLDNQVGTASVGEFKVLSAGKNTIIGYATVNVKPFGGSADEVSSWEMELAYSGEPEFGDDWS
jgi:hypothetical protein